MENVENRTFKDFFKNLWTKVKPYLPAILLCAAIIAVVIIFTYFYFACSFGFIPSDGIADENAIKKSDWLMFWGSILAVFCTLSLALVSYRQNKDLQKINDDRERKDTFFAKLRFAAEFYSMIEIDAVLFSAELDQTATVTLDLVDSGKTPSTSIDLTQIIIKPSDEVEKSIGVKFEPLTGLILHHTKSEIKRRKLRGEKEDTTKRSVCFSVDFNQFKKFQNLYGDIFELFQQNGEIRPMYEPILILSLKYVIDNNLNVKTNVSCEVKIKNTLENFSIERAPDRFVFEVIDLSIVKIQYDFVGETY